jgi:hypothetical protein
MLRVPLFDDISDLRHPFPVGQTVQVLDGDRAGSCRGLRRSLTGRPGSPEELPQAPSTSVPATIAATEAIRRVRRVIMSTLFLE